MDLGQEMTTITDPAGGGARVTFGYGSGDKRAKVISQLWGTTETVALAVRPLGEDFLNAYLDAEYEAVRGNVGGYRVEGLGAQLFEAIEGSHFAVLGLPLLPLLAFLRGRGILPS